MTLALLSLVAAAVCSGTATVLQAVAARREPVTPGLDLGLVLRLARSATYLAALVLVAAGFALSFWALRTLPLFLVQAGRASSLVVAAALGVLVLGARLRRRDVAALVGVGAGLVLLTSSAAPQAALPASGRTTVVLLVLLAVLVATAALVARLPSQRGAGLALAVAAGAAFAALATGGRTLRSLDPADLVVDPVAWLTAAAGTLGLVLVAMALQRAPVVVATAVMVAVETALGALLGLLLAGDRPAIGAESQAVAGFVIVLVGALVLARFGAPDATQGAGRAQRGVRDSWTNSL